MGPEDSGGTRAGGLSSGRVCRPARGRLGGQPSDSQPGHHVPTHPECRQWLHVLLPGHQGLDSESFSFGAISVLETCRALPFLTPRRALGQLSGTSVDPSLPSGFFLESLQQAFCSSLPGCPIFLPLLDGKKSRIFTPLEEAINEFSVSPARSGKTLDNVSQSPWASRLSSFRWDRYRHTVPAPRRPPRPGPRVKTRGGSRRVNAADAASG